MKTYKPFTVVAVPFPFTDGPKSKRRPALVVSEETFQKKTEHVTLLMITSAKHSHWYGDQNISDIEASGLSAPSIVRQKIFTLDLRLIEKPVGRLSKKDIGIVRKSIKANINLR